MSTFPRVIYQDGNVFFLDHEIDRYLAELAGSPVPETPPPSQWRLVKNRVLQQRLAISPRTVSRHISEAYPSGPGGRTNKRPPGTRKQQLKAAVEG